MRVLRKIAVFFGSELDQLVHCLRYFHRTYNIRRRKILKNCPIASLGESPVEVPYMYFYTIYGLKHLNTLLCRVVV